MANRWLCVVALVGVASPCVACCRDSCPPPASPEGAATETKPETAPPAEAPTEGAPAEEVPAEGASLESGVEETQPVIAAEFGAERGTEMSTAAPNDAMGGESLYLRCGADGPSFGVRVEGQQAELSLPFGNVRLPEVASAEGTRFSDGKFTLARQGNSAKYQDDQGRKFDCTNDPQWAVWSDARRRGVEMRAVGPDRGGWVLEMTLTRVALFLGDEAERIDIDTPSPKGYLESDEESYWGRDDDEYTLLSVTRADEECTDPRTGEKFDLRVEVSLNGHSMAGCGRSLRDRPYER
jgi:hypothetical protein